jgi:hypothetical protein
MVDIVIDYSAKFVSGIKVPLNVICIHLNYRDEIRSRIV